MSTHLVAFIAQRPASRVVGANFCFHCLDLGSYRLRTFAKAGLLYRDLPVAYLILKN